MVRRSKISLVTQSKVVVRHRCSNAPYRPIREPAFIAPALESGEIASLDQREDVLKASAEAASSEMGSEKRASIG